MDFDSLKPLHNSYMVTSTVHAADSSRSQKGHLSDVYVVLSLILKLSCYFCGFGLY